MILDVLVVGGGLSGMVIAQRLSLATHLHWKLLEARSVLGGRLCNDETTHEIDLGGAWIWPEHQPKVAKLIKSLGIETFPQPGDPESTRIVGGAFELIQKLSRQVPNKGSSIQLDAQVRSCSLVTPAGNTSNGTGVDDTCSTPDEEPYVEIKTKDDVFRARHVVFAVPPKLLSAHLDFDPPLDSEKKSAMEASHTWMAGVTKIALVYPQRFWDVHYANTGLPPGSGPAFQMYDSSTKDASIAAITFFALVPSNTPAYSDNQVLAELVGRQLGSMWNMMGQREMGEKAHSYTSYHVQSWPKEVYISEDDKPTRINPHPSPVFPLTTTDWNGMLHFAGTETDRRSPGVIEGAIGAAERVIGELKLLLAGK